MSSLPPLITEFSTISSGYDVVLSDVWGVIHNGIAYYPHACDALMRLRARGGVVVLITNAPRPSESVARQLDRLDVPRETYDAIVSSGDVTRSVIKQRHGQSLYHLGPDRDRSIFNGLDVNFAPPQTADYVVCSGLKDDEAKHRTITVRCSNPCLRANCSWCAAIRTSSSSAVRRLSIAQAR